MASLGSTGLNQHDTYWSVCFQKIQVQSHMRHRSQLLAGEFSPSLIQQLLLISHLSHVECCRHVCWCTGSLCFCLFLCAGDTTEHPNLYVSHVHVTFSWPRVCRPDTWLAATDIVWNKFIWSIVAGPTLWTHLLKSSMAADGAIVSLHQRNLCICQLSSAGSNYGLFQGVFLLLSLDPHKPHQAWTGMGLK